MTAKAQGGREVRCWQRLAHIKDPLPRARSVRPVAKVLDLVGKPRASVMAGLCEMLTEMGTIYLCACLVRAHRLAIPNAKSRSKNNAAVK
jgi:hypothetical protein